MRVGFSGFFDRINFLQVNFKQVDIVSERIPILKSSVIFCFSVTLWIHINHGDEGLRTFLTTLSESCQYLVLETQPWKCYRTAARRAKRANQPPFPFYDKLTIRSNVTEYIDNYLVEKCNMCQVEHLGSTDWSRDIILYKSLT